MNDLYKALGAFLDVDGDDVDRYTQDCQEVFPRLEQALGDTHHWFQYDARDNKMICSCSWHVEAPFLEAIRLHEKHRRDVKLAILKSFAFTLQESPA